MRRYLATVSALILGLAQAGPVCAAVTFAGHVAVAGEATDLAPGSGPNVNRLSFGSDLFYNPGNQTFYGISDRGPGGGLVDWAPRVEAFKLDFSAAGAISNFNLTQTTIFKQANGQPYSGLTPSPASNLGAALDSEGIVRMANGHFLVSDEYGPSIYETDAAGKFVRAFTTPQNVVPKANGTPNYADGRPTVNSGRQDNRGYEGMTISGDGKTAWAILQDPLVNEGAQNDGRRSRNLRIVQYDVATGKATSQFLYRLENTSDINGRIPGTADDFNATAQGRNIGVSSISWIGGSKFLVIERDNRGVGVGDVNGTVQVGSKRVYMIDLAGASDISNVSLAGSNAIPSGVVPVSKSLFLDVQDALTKAGVTVAEKMEGLAIGPQLANGGFALLIATDNDFSVTQTGSGEQFDVCSDGSQVRLGAGCLGGANLLPSHIYSFAVTGADAAGFDRSLFSVPEPASWAMMVTGFGAVGFGLRRRRSVQLGIA